MLTHSSFFKFVAIDDPHAIAARLKSLCPPLLGSLIVATEGLSGVFAGDPSEVLRVEQALHDPQQLGQWFDGMTFKHSACVTAPFGRLSIHVKRELLQLGAPDITDAYPASDHQSLDPADWRKLIAEPDVLVLDNRNHFEFRLGHFTGAVNPGVENFRDFTQYVQQHASQWKGEGRKIAMYCTGGIRCEKTSAWMRAQGLEVFQLSGGILNYFEKTPDAERDWQGECFVFDNRIAINTRLEETSTSPEDVYTGSEENPSERWRLQRARRLEEDS